MSQTATAPTSTVPRATVFKELPADKGGIRPMRVNVPEEELVDLRRRIEATRWPERETVAMRARKELQKEWRILIVGVTNKLHRRRHMRGKLFAGNGNTSQAVINQAPLKMIQTTLRQQGRKRIPWEIDYPRMG